MMTSRSLICLLENQNGGKLQKVYSNTQMTSFECFNRSLACSNRLVKFTVLTLVA
jgi:hypothetical protein